MVIASAKHPIIRQAVSLRERSERDVSGLTRIEGFEEILFAVSHGCIPISLIYARALIGEQRRLDLVQSLQARGVDIYEVTKQVFEKIAYREGADGWLAIVRSPATSLDRVRNEDLSFVVVADALEKPGNIGAILRTCDAAGVELVIHANPVTDWGNPNVIRASKGAVFTVDVAQATTEETIAWLRERSVRIVVATPNAPKLYTHVNYRDPVAIVVGAENQGVNQSWLDQADFAVRIPMVGRVDSLNVATSCALLVYEVVRQRHEAPFGG